MTWVLTISKFFLRSIFFTFPLQRAFFTFLFQKACQNTLDLYFKSHILSAEQDSSFPLFSADTLFTSLALNAAKFFVFLSRIKCQTCWSFKEKKKIKKKARLLLPLSNATKSARLTSQTLGKLLLSLLGLRHDLKHALF